MVAEGRDGGILYKYALCRRNVCLILTAENIHPHDYGQLLGAACFTPPTMTFVCAQCSLAPLRHCWSVHPFGLVVSDPASCVTGVVITLIKGILHSNDTLPLSDTNGAKVRSFVLTFPFPFSDPFRVAFIYNICIP